MKRFKKMDELRREQFYKVLSAVLDHYGKKHLEILRVSRARDLVEPRQVVSYLAYTLINKITQEEIVYWLGYNERSVISTGVKTTRERMEVDSSFREKIETIKNKIDYDKRS